MKGQLLGCNHIGCRGACVGLRVWVERLRCTNLGHIYCWNLTCTIIYCTLLTWWWHVTYLTPMWHLGTCVHMWKHTCKVFSNEPWNIFHLVITHSHVQYCMPHLITFFPHIKTPHSHACEPHIGTTRSHVFVPQWIATYIFITYFHYMLIQI
jgi:hypothetical protein